MPSLCKMLEIIPKHQHDQHRDCDDRCHHCDGRIHLVTLFVGATVGTHGTCLIQRLRSSHHALTHVSAGGRTPAASGFYVAIVAVDMLAAHFGTDDDIDLLFALCRLTLTMWITVTTVITRLIRTAEMSAAAFTVVIVVTGLNNKGCVARTIALGVEVDASHKHIDSLDATLDSKSLCLGGWSVILKQLHFGHNLRDRKRAEETRARPNVNRQREIAILFVIDVNIADMYKRLPSCRLPEGIDLHFARRALAHRGDTRIQIKRRGIQGAHSTNDVLSSRPIVFAQGFDLVFQDIARNFDDWRIIDADQPDRYRHLCGLIVGLFEIVPLIGESLVCHPHLQRIDPIGIIIANVGEILLFQNHLQRRSGSLKQQK
mmetsp:Transcript_33462/g.48927  ORF Transcript_33462/g.48927 Transcript_33462/m.48927 type:complete len:373 (-) Transcript_33462:823-1941(-)